MSNSNHTIRSARRFRRVMWGIGIGYLFESLLLFGFWHAGYVHLVIAVAFSALFLLGWTLLAVVFMSGLNRKMKDSQLFLPQFVFGVATNSALLIFAPQISIQPLLVMSIIFVYSFNAPDQKSLVAAWITAAAGIVLTFVFATRNMSIPSTTLEGRILIFLVLAGFFLRGMGFVAYVRKLQTSVQTRNRELKELLKANDQLLNFDLLTGAANRRNLMNFLNNQIDSDDGITKKFCLAIMDIDNFKLVNDRLGHLKGDEVLREVSKEIQSVTRSSDLFGRWGGEEFLMIMPSVTLGDGKKLLERVRQRIESLDWKYIDASLRVTITSGLGEFRPGEPPQTLIQRADAALYLGKKSGRNRVMDESALE